ncbi:uncharacterized protein MCYG_06456 [Microsporum canis CBS 113480]|uniref:Uncharacterized protein n=1 Tax=Arthroderma otae (strain ATCC MYA-4605 / CBS 113480) TaxID=554155 RepID=C5FUQ3_ARTOC|nr:uncharacterized protein MCYG_06456 [Microsporum canis CBS 113480]EEQ33637.1 predicted protein [Microsporum canis CBS 113480]
MKRLRLRYRRYHASQETGYVEDTTADRRRQTEDGRQDIETRDIQRATRFIVPGHAVIGDQPVLITAFDARNLVDGCYVRRGMRVLDMGDMLWSRAGLHA